MYKKVEKSRLLLTNLEVIHLCFFFANLLCHFFRVIRDAAHHGKLAYLVSEARLPHSGIVDNFDPLRLGLTVN